MKGTSEFEKTIKAFLDKQSADDPLFAKKYSNPKKNIKDCCTYILNAVKKSGRNGFTDDEVYGMAMHYYDEDNIKVGSPVSGTVVVNHHVELTEEEKQQARERAMDRLVDEEKQKLIKEGVPAVELTDEEKKEARQKALDRLVEEERQKLLNKQPKKKADKDADQEVQPTLF